MNSYFFTFDFISAVVTEDMNSYFLTYEFISGGAMCEVPPRVRTVGSVG